MYIETQIFRLPPDLSEDDFLAQDARTQRELMLGAAGLIRRTTARGDDGDWLTITLWGEREQAVGARDDAIVKGYTDIGG